MKGASAKMEPQYQAIFFDFDYTLADSSRGVVECINFALVKLGLDQISFETACRTIGLSLPDTFTYLTGEKSAARRHEFSRLFVQRSDDVMAPATILFASVPQTITLLKRAGFTLGIVSTKFRCRIESVLHREGLLDQFDVIIGGKDVSEHKPSPEGLFLAMEAANCVPIHSLYVGDSVVDAKAASQAGVPFVAVLSGVTLRNAFEGFAVQAILEGVNDLSRWLGVAL
jgi:phosphoglycolate phosphatase